MSGERAVCDVKLRDTMMPGGIARKVEMVAAVLYDKEFFPGEPQIALFMAGRWSRADGFKPFMCQKMRGHYLNSKNVKTLSFLYFLEINLYLK